VYWHTFSIGRGMKKQIILIALILGTCFGHVAHAQVNIQANIGIQPLWGPTGYDHVDYYYMPDIDAYYDVTNRQYVYNENNSWVTRPSLPPRYAHYDMYHSYKAVVNEREPWRNNDRYRKQYAGYRGRHDQQVIRDSRDRKYWENENHPQHGKYHPEGANGRGHDQDHENEGPHGNR
jgi:hypothetical protein